MLNARNPIILLAALSVLLVLTAACTTTLPTPPPTAGGTTIKRTPTPVPATDEEAIRQLINAECEAVVQQDVDRLQSMWANNGVVTDANHTKDNAGDDVTWKSWDALRDRYVNLIFPSNPTFCEHPDIQVNINGSNATATSSVKIGVTNCQNCNLWAFTKANDGWRITALTYNLNPQ
ncbi:MAG: nuclear transport factor 2 family protein [Chloroflexi bacterium]|nr:nuclear transport factor 2 family protein [Chloroflexota bacterium]